MRIVVTAVLIAAATPAISQSRAWREVTSDRAFRTDYVNRTSSEMVISVSTYSGTRGQRCAVSLTVGSVSKIGYQFVNNSVGAAMCSASAVVPAGKSYSADNEDVWPGVCDDAAMSDTNICLARWFELSAPPLIRRPSRR